MDLEGGPEAPAGAGVVPVPQEEPQKLGKPLETPKADEEAPTVSSKLSSVEDTYLCLPTRCGTLFWSMVSSIFVFSGLLAFSFADLGFCNDSQKLSSTLFWRCIGVGVLFYIPILVVATPMERNLVFLAAVWCTFGKFC